ncbi:deoxyribose-phosphate aldolase [Neolentinus lepideus HHB14362 ss-1]|uniref:deoxyribose-phosphate aldolase n=1 Tax=Neolentinus lepideus HHB14362 ss-1 TaxID=1314782 RepID=A0A165QB69_9AGAM|nr:deoxyribose-phosphate aldolase [Neolentinus lepideus HHB14362 ss-1]
MASANSKPLKSIANIARFIDHSLLHPSMTDAEIIRGLQLARDCKVATACIKPYSIPNALEILQGSGVGICVVIGFPHGNSTIKIKVTEAAAAMDALADFVRTPGNGPAEIDMVVNVGKVLSGEWNYVENEIAQINSAVVERGGTLKVIFENDFLDTEHIIRLSEICTRVGVAFVKTSTGFGFVKDPASSLYTYKGATIEHIQVMKQSVGPAVQIKAAGGIRTLDQFLQAYKAGATRFGATATEAILNEAKGRGYPEN